MVFTNSRRFLTLVLTLALAAVTALPAHAQATTFTERVVVPLDVFIISPCNGEEVHLTGELHLTSQTTIDARGGIHSRFTLVPRNNRGVGSDTGTQYSLVGGHRWNFTADADSAPLTYTDGELINLVSLGGSDNFQFKFIIHVTVNANGVESVVVDLTSQRCVG